MAASMARQGGQVQLKQTDMSLASNMANMIKAGFLGTAMEKTQQLIKRLRTEVREGKK
jgi:hypothetical protein